MGVLKNDKSKWWAGTHQMERSIKYAHVYFSLQAPGGAIMYINLSVFKPFYAGFGVVL